MASRLATLASYGIVGCLGGGHDKENEQHARENTPVGSNEFNKKGGGRSVGMDAAASEYASE